MLAKIPGFFKVLLPHRVWNFSREEKILYLTFDDGPIPEVTPWVLDQLKQYEAKATFFCIGDNIQKNPVIFRQLLSEGHTVGNHTQNHLNGWRTRSSKYVQNVLEAQKVIQETAGEAGPVSNLFRPPYGRLKEKQAKMLRKLSFSIVMWEVISMDYNKNISSESCFRKVIRNAAEGSIVIFHDSLKAEKNLKLVLPRVLKHYAEAGFEFRALPSQPGLLQKPTE